MPASEDEEEKIPSVCLNNQKSAVTVEDAIERRQRKGPAPKYKKEKSLGILCQQFISLFVAWKKVISLEEAARQISDDDETMDEQRLKTKIRRLYDIANVLQSIGLIHKTQKSQQRKPAFQWIGLDSVRATIGEMKIESKPEARFESPPQLANDFHLKSDKHTCPN